MDPGIVKLDKVEIPSGYNIHSSPWKDPPCLIGKPSVSIRAIYWQGHRIPELWGQNFGSIQTRRASWPNHSCGFGVESVSQLGDPGRKNTLKSVINGIDCTFFFLKSLTSTFTSAPWWFAIFAHRSSSLRHHPGHWNILTGVLLRVFQERMRDSPKFILCN